MSKGSSGQHGSLCLRGHEGRIPGCPRDPPDSMGQLCERDMKRGSQDVLGIPGYPKDPPDSCVRGT